MLIHIPTWLIWAVMIAWPIVSLIAWLSAPLYLDAFGWPTVPGKRAAMAKVSLVVWFLVMVFVVGGMVL